MSEVEETRLPGVGVRYEFTTEQGRRLGLLAHLSGRRELIVYDPADPDTADTVALGSDDVRVLAELLGADHVTERLGDLRQSLRGLEIDWLAIEEGSPHAGGPLEALGLGHQHGVTAVAVLRGEETVPSPGPGFGLQAGDTVVLAGTPDAIRAALRRLAAAR